MPIEELLKMYQNMHDEKPVGTDKNIIEGEYYFAICCFTFFAISRVMQYSVYINACKMFLDEYIAWTTF